MSYGRHQSFFLKRHWVNKGINTLNKDGENVFVDKDKYKDLGIGKNMHQALRYWLETINIIDYKRKERKHELSDFGHLVQKFDPAGQSLFTLALVHYHLVKYDSDKNRRADTFYWFFNENKNTYITKSTFIEELEDYSQGRISRNTLSRDIDCLFQTYTKKTRSHPEDKNISLLANLNLLIKDEHFYVKKPLTVNDETSKAFYYILNEYDKDEHKESFKTTLDSVTEEIGTLFNWNRTKTIESIELLNKLKYPVHIDRTNNLDTIHLNEKRDPEELLQDLFNEVFGYEN